MKNTKVLAILASISLFFSACQENAPLNQTNLYSEDVSINSVVKASDVIELKSLNSTISDTDSGVIVATLSGGELDTGLKQKLYFNFQDPTSSKELEFNDSNLQKQKDKRHGKSFQQFIKEKNKAQKAYKAGRVIKSKPVNAILKVGSTRSFNVLVGDDGKFVKRNAVLQKISKNGLFWVDKEAINNIDEKALEKSVKYWEEKAFPIVTSKFGPAPVPPADVDGEAKIHLFLTPLEEGLYGYFYSADVMYDGSPESNKADMLYINSDIFLPGKLDENSANGTLIHEFQHLVNFNNKVTQKINNKKEPVYEDSWLDEGMSTYAEQLGGYGLPKNDEFSAKYLKSFFGNTSKVPIVTNSTINYGTSLLFVLYLVEQYGVDVLKKLTLSDKSGIENIELMTGKPFKNTFNDWATALLLSGSSKYSKYDFKSVNLHKSYGEIKLDGVNLNNLVNSYPQKVGFSMSNWTVNYLKLDNLSKNKVNMNIKHNGNGTLTTTLVKLK